MASELGVLESIAKGMEYFPVIGGLAKIVNAKYNGSIITKVIYGTLSTIIAGALLSMPFTAWNTWTTMKQSQENSEQIHDVKDRINNLSNRVSRIEGARRAEQQ